MVWDVQTKTTRVGKFGCKASSSSLKQQIAAAYAKDMGVTNPLFKNGAHVPDISSTVLDATTFYSATLGVPMARNQADAVVAQGRTLISALRCHSCHTPILRTGDGVDTSLSHQTIHPLSDLLLHDMGTELSDNRPDFRASGREWKTFLYGESDSQKPFSRDEPKRIFTMEEPELLRRPFCGMLGRRARLKLDLCNSRHLSEMHSLRS